MMIAMINLGMRNLSFTWETVDSQVSHEVIMSEKGVCINKNGFGKKYQAVIKLALVPGPQMLIHASFQGGETLGEGQWSL